MTDQIVFISRHRIKEGKLEGFKQRYRQGVEVMEKEKPGTVAFLAYLDEDGSEVSIVHVFPDRQAMDAHMKGVEERSKGAFEYLDPQSFDVYGQPSEGVIEMLRQSAEMRGMTLNLKPERIGGYIRLRRG